MKSLISNEKVVLSTLWVFVLMNMIYADILNTLKPEYLKELEYVGDNISEETVLLFALLMEVPIAMILLSRTLKRKCNRILNLIAAPISILWVIVPSIVLNEGNTSLSYIFFASIETIAMLFIIWYSYRWGKE
ncbi:DUF6326 family protein [Reichenbachiella ulvae]|uniref:DUF6326 family protein n=1 Tax=Reichenbachiella ulvae TaxID=2980104 RepID=A0ABT3CTV6_9BACT|nr:DUF6326 family protein [Reichenbachiella ulvae]MCV9386974.1 DUF6326 family protein [Reichenbachiella ulvae]